MPDLSVEIAGLKLKNPIGVSSCPASRDAKRIRKAFSAGAAFAVTKTISTQPASLFVPKPHMAELKIGFFNAELWSELSLEEWLERELPESRKIAKENNGALIVSVGHKPSEVREVVEHVYYYADAIEVSLAYLEEIDDMRKAVKYAKEVSGKPVIAKPGVIPHGRIAGFVDRMLEAGADAFNFTDSYGPVLALDISTFIPREQLEGRALLGSRLGLGWLSGGPLKYMTMRMIAEAKLHRESLQIFAIENISSGYDALELMLVGANAIQVCTSVILTNYKSISVIINQLSELVERMGHESIKNVIGQALRKLPKEELKIFTPTYNRDKCVGCGLCAESCMYDAIETTPQKKIKINYSKCFGCGLCITRCRYGALNYT